MSTYLTSGSNLRNFNRGFFAKYNFEIAQFNKEKFSKMMIARVFLFGV